MKKADFLELINITTLEKMAENLYAATGISMGITGTGGEVYLSVGWQDICVNFHRKNPVTCERCKMSDRYINGHIDEYNKNGKYIAYKCLNNMWDVGIPLIISGQCIATIYMGQFFYEDEVIDEEYFRAQAIEFGFDEEEYLAALKKVPIFSKEKVEHIMQYFSALVSTLAESGLRLLESEKLQKELEKSEQYMNTIINSVNDGIFIHDMSGNIIDINKAAADMYGYTHDELVGMNIGQLISVNSPNTFDQLMQLINNTSEEQPLVIELFGKNKESKDLWIEVNLHVTKIDDSNRVVAAVRDITDRKKAEMELQNKAREMEQLRTEFFSNISHELKTPLNIILGSMQIIDMIIKDKEKPINIEKINSNLNMQRQNCIRLLRLINNLIDLNKLDSGDFDLNLTNCNVVNLVEEITLSVADYIKNNNINLVFDTDIEEKIMACDLDKIERIILNLLSNAVKFTNNGGSIFVNIFDGEEFITITVEDTGIGIPEDKLDIIFDRFRQVDKSFTRSHEGSGIGLSIVKLLVDMQGGDISVESKYGVGTKFTIKLPVKTVETQGSNERNKLSDGIIDNHVERVKFEFSDIYN